MAASAVVVRCRQVLERRVPRGLEEVGVVAGKIGLHLGQQQADQVAIERRVTVLQQRSPEIDQRRRECRLWPVQLRGRLFELLQARRERFDPTLIQLPHLGGRQRPLVDAQVVQPTLPMLTRAATRTDKRRHRPHSIVIGPGAVQVADFCTVQVHTHDPTVERRGRMMPGAVENLRRIERRIALDVPVDVEPQRRIVPLFWNENNSRSAHSWR